MNKPFSIYDSPLSEETKKLRRNVLIASSICIFISMTNQLPSSFALWGAKFSSEQQTTVGWLLFSVTLYLFLHFVSSAGIEIAKWVQPFYEGVITKRNLLRHPAYDETDWMELFREDDLNDIEKAARSEAHLHVQKKLRHVYNLIYLKLTIEILLPLLIGIAGLVMLALECKRINTYICITVAVFVEKFALKYPVKYRTSYTVIVPNAEKPRAVHLQLMGM